MRRGVEKEQRRSGLVNLKDTFGKALVAHHRGEPADHVIERDDGLIEEIDTGIYLLEYDDWPEFEREAMLEAKGRVLDVGCGAGRAAVWLQERGHDVVGIDVSPLALEVSRLRGVRDCRLTDVRELDFPDGAFDTVLMLGNNLGIGGDAGQTKRILESLHRITADEGIVIAETRDPLKTDDPAHLAYHERNRGMDRPPGLVKIRIGFGGGVRRLVRVPPAGGGGAGRVVGAHRLGHIEGLRFGWGNLRGHPLQGAPRPIGDDVSAHPFNMFRP